MVFARVVNPKGAETEQRAKLGNRLVKGNVHLTFSIACYTLKFLNLSTNFLKISDPLHRWKNDVGLSLTLPKFYIMFEMWLCKGEEV